MKFASDTSSSEGEVIDGTSLTEAQLDEIRDSGKDYNIKLTYDQAVRRTAEVTGKPVEKIKRENPNRPDSSTRTVYSVAATNTCSWHETSTTHTVKSYNPKLIVIVKACRNGSFGWLANERPLLQEFRAASKEFKGTIQVSLKSSGYDYVVNGNFYNTGDTQHSGTVGITTVFTATYTVAGAQNLYGSLYTGVKYKQVTN